MAATARSLFSIPLLLLLVLGGPGRAEEPPGGEAEESRSLGAALLEAEDLLVHRFEISCNTYFLTCRRTQRFAVIDPGPGILEAVRVHEGAGHALAAIWITHEHGDHVGGLGEVLAAREVPVVLHEEAKRALPGLRERWTEWGFPEGAPPPPEIGDEGTADGAVVRIGRLELRALYVPGHAPGSLVFLLEGRLLLAGDVLFRGNVGRTDLPTSDAPRFHRSLGEKIWDLADETVVLPGHGERTTIGQEKASNWLFQDFVRAGRGLEPLPRPWLGIGVNPDREDPGVEISEVVEASPAAAAGLEPGDVITVFDGVVVSDVSAFVARLRTLDIGDEVPVAYVRGGEERSTAIRLGTRPPP